jgi:hypothetical protein
MEVPGGWRASWARGAVCVVLNGLGVARLPPPNRRGRWARDIAHPVDRALVSAAQGRI